MLTGAAGEFSSPESALCAGSYLVSFHSRVTAVAHKRFRSFCQKRRLQITPKHAYTLDPMKLEWAMLLCRHSGGNLSGNELTSNTSGNTWPQPF